MSKNLLIVESPAKAKTIERYLGKDFKVKSCFGHIRDLDKGDKGIDIENNFKPKYIVSPEKKKVVRELKDHVKKVQEVWLATDEDREGEAISWHLCKELGLDETATKRIVFREITKSAIEKAIESPRTVDINLVNAQQARRVLDRLVGFELSEILWKKIRNKLSAGRVQSVALKLVVDKERSIQGFQTKSYFKVIADFLVEDKDGKQKELKAELSQRFENENSAREFLEKCIGAQFTISDISVKPSYRKPAPPFTTSTLQQDASRKLGFSVNRTMQNAQRLYEKGLITYMRTDSTNLSSTATQSIKKEIIASYGERYSKERTYKSKSNAQEAHEAIRPSYIDRPQGGENRDEQRLYELIWKRTIASQMANAELEKTQVKIAISTTNEVQFEAEGEVLKFDGFLKIYLEGKDEDENGEAKGMLPQVSIGQSLLSKIIQAQQRFTRAPARFTEAGLVKKLEELGIGRPSTYAPIITKIMEEGRGYVTKESREGIERKYTILSLEQDHVEKLTESEITGATSNRLYPTDMGMIVADFLTDHFDQIMTYSFTADCEKEFDVIANGKRNWTEMIDSFYGPFHENVEKTIQNAERASGERKLGIDPVSGKTIIVRMSRFGPVVQIGLSDELAEDEKPRYANLKPGQSLEIISLEEALDLFKLPRNLGDYEDSPVSIGSGRYGPYVKYGEQFISLPKSDDPLTISKERAVEIIIEKKKEDAPIGFYKEEPISKGKGRFGPFLKIGALYVNIPKRIDPETLTLEEAIELIEQKMEKEANRYIHQWEKEKVAVENGRWGPFIRYKRKAISFPKIDGEKMTKELAADLTLDQVKEIIETVQPGTFKAKAKKKKL